MSNTYRGALIALVVIFGGMYFAQADHSIMYSTPPWPGILIWIWHGLLIGIPLVAIAAWERRR